MRPVSSIHVHRFRDGQYEEADDLVVTEEPLEIRIQMGEEADRSEHSLSVTMRTPGNDLELAAGFLLTEGIISDPSDILHIRYCETVKREEERGNVVKAVLKSGVAWDPAANQRHFYTTSSCGVCGKASLDAVRVKRCEVPSQSDFKVTAGTLLSLSDRTLESQTLFRHTGGIHAAALFDAQGELVIMREDVGRHNAVDKVIGAMAMQGRFPLQDHLLFVSGRAGFELVQKAAVAGIPLMAAVGAPSSLAVQLAQESALTLVGFLRSGKFNVYAHGERIVD